MCSTVAAESATFREFSAGPDGVRTKSHPITGQIVPTISVRKIFICVVIDLRLIILHRMIHSSLDPTNRVRQGSQYRQIRPLRAGIPGGKLRMYLSIGTLDQTKLFFSLTILVLFSNEMFHFFRGILPVLLCKAVTFMLRNLFSLLI